MAIDRDALVLLDTIQAEYRTELGKFVDAFNALVASYVALKFATQAEVDAGTSTTTVINPKTMSEHLRTRRFSVGTTSSGAQDGQRAPMLGAVGLLDVSFLALATATDMQQGLNAKVLVTALTFANEVAARITAALDAAISAGPASAGPVDEGRAPVLNSTGKLDPSYLDPVPSLYVGAMDATQAGGGLVPPIVDRSNAHQAGAYAVVMIEGHYSFLLGAPDPTGVFLTPLDVVYFNGMTWDRIPNPMNVTEFLRRDGSLAMTGSLIFTPLAGGAAQHFINGAIIECGTF